MYMLKAHYFGACMYHIVRFPQTHQISLETNITEYLWIKIMLYKSHKIELHFMSTTEQ